MSAPGVVAKQAQCINYSFLSIKAEKALQALLGGRQLSDEERDALFRAEHFLKTIASGAAFVATGAAQHDVDPMEAVSALDYAMEPIGQLEQLLADDDIAKFFDAVADAVRTSADHPQALTDDENKKISFAERFFHVLYDILASHLSKINTTDSFRKPSLGTHAA